MKRIPLAVILGGILGASVGAGLFGLWDRVYLLPIPVVYDSNIALGAGCGALAGLVWGIFISFHKKWWVGYLAGGGFIACLLLIFPSTRYTLLILPLVFLSWIFAYLVRWLAVKTTSGNFLPQKSHWKGAVFAASIVLVCGFLLTWPLDQVNESLGGRRAVLQKMDRYARSQGWQDYRLKFLSMESDFALVVVTRENGEDITCRVNQWQFQAPAEQPDLNLLGIDCEH